MSRKKEPTHVTEKNIFPTRLRKLMEDQSITQKKLADAIEMRPQTVSLYTTGQSAPDVNTLRKMAEFFHVSSDYLIGLTDVQKPDTTIQAICEYTGLSERAVSALRSLRNECQTHKTPPLSDKVAELAKFGRIPNEIDMLNYLISNLRFQGVLSDLVEVGQCSVMLRFPMELLNTKQELMLRNFHDGYQFISPFEYSRLARYELSTDFERMVDVFISEIQDYKGGPENAIHQEND